MSYRKGDDAPAKRRRRLPFKAVVEEREEPFQAADLDELGAEWRRITNGGEFLYSVERWFHGWRQRADDPFRPPDRFPPADAYPHSEGWDSGVSYQCPAGTDWLNPEPSVAGIRQCASYSTKICDARNCCASILGRQNPLR
jgi:hypothetical protein